MPGLEWEAETFTLWDVFQIGTHAEASGGQYIYVDENEPDCREMPCAEKASKWVFVPQAGTYRLQCRVAASGSNRNSFWVQVDAGPIWLWDTVVGIFHTEYVSDVYTPVEIWLGMGSHNLAFYARETGAMLDWVRLEQVSGSAAQMETE